MSPLKGVRQTLRESSDLGKILTLPSADREVVVYAEDTFSYIQLGGYLERLWQDHGIAFQYLTSDPEDPVLTEPMPGGTTWYIQSQLPRLLERLECRVFITTMPDIGRFHVPRPKSGKTVYVFHSLNSTHTAYRQGAFDHYDVLLCAGPHHVSELTALRGSAVELPPVGYHKLDLVRAEYQRWIAETPGSGRQVLIAPSWGAQNLLESCGAEIIRTLLASEFRVVVRPHPQFFHSLYPEGREVIDRLIEEFGALENVQFELSIDTQDSFYASDLMISDWSGAAYEYALGTLRPVLFIDTPQKIFNERWKDLGLESFENAMRERCGVVVPVDQVDEIGSVAHRLISSSVSANTELETMARERVFNLDSAAQAGAAWIAAELA